MENARQRDAGHQCLLQNQEPDERRSKLGWCTRRCGAHQLGICLRVALVLLVVPAEALQKFPLWSAGGNLEGQLGVSTNAGTSNPNEEPQQLSSSSFEDREIVGLETSRGHSIALTLPTSDDVTENVPVGQPRVAFVWGNNRMGQLAQPVSAVSSMLPEPLRLSRSLFPRGRFGNEVSNSSNFFKFARWNASIAAVEFFNATLQEGHKDLGMLQAEMNSLIGDDVVSISTNPDSEAVVVSVVQRGYQLDFSASPGLSALLGFSRPFQLPERGVLNEISSRAGNNVLSYAYSPGGIEISAARGNTVFQYRAWDGLTSATAVYSVPLSSGVYSPSEVAAALNAFAASVGHPADLFDFGPAGLALSERAVLKLRHAGFVFLFQESGQAQSGGLGFQAEVPASALYWQVTGEQVPNEVSPAALNTRFAYSFIAADHATVRHFELDMPAGVYSLAAVQARISAFLASNAHPADAVQLFADADGRVALLLPRPGFRVRFTGSSLGRYLGFPDQDIPCDPSLPLCATPAPAAVNCSAVPAGFGRYGCGFSNGSVVAHASAPRPLAPETTPSGTCADRGGEAATCACGAADGAGACVGSGGVEAAGANESCGCAARGVLLEAEAEGAWAYRELEVELPAGVYGLVELNAEVQQQVRGAVGGGPYFVFFEQGAGNETRLSVGFVGEGFAVDFARSSAASLLGFAGRRVPAGNFSGPGFDTHSGDRAAPLVAQQASVAAAAAGEWVVAAAAGAEHTVVQTFDAETQRTRVWAFGSNEFGQLGSEEGMGARREWHVPRLVKGSGMFNPRGAQQVLAGGYHSGVVDAQGRLWLFGQNRYGQLGRSAGAGNGTQWEGSAEPRLVEQAPWARSRLLQVVLGAGNTLVLANSSNGTRLWGFGDDAVGQLGAGEGWSNATARRSVPVLVGGAAGRWAGVCAGGSHTLLVSGNGTLWAAGGNRYGQLGLKNSRDLFTDKFFAQATPVPVGTDSLEPPAAAWEVNPFRAAVAQVVCGSDHNVALLADGTLWAFGLNAFGQLLVSDNVGVSNPNPDPEAVSPLRFLGAEEAVAPQQALRLWAAGEHTFVQTARELCPEGQYSADGRQPCFWCEGGTTSLQPGSAACVGCAPGSFSLSGFSECRLCGVGAFANESGMTACTRCPDASPTTRGLGSSTPDNCTVPCPNGTFGAFGALPCLPCAQGSFSLAAAEECTPCPLGTYQPSPGAAACIPCPSGESTPGEGEVDAAQCTPVCPAGSEGPFGLEPCTLCGLGSFAASPQAASCELCSADSFANASGLSRCFACPDGFGTQGPGSSSAAECELLCLPGFFHAVWGDPCQPCAPGSFAREIKSFSCDLCPPGSASGAASPNCTLCPPGTAAAGAGNEVCGECQVGEYDPAGNATACLLCPLASFANDTGMTRCVDCPAGLFTAREGAKNESECLQLCDYGTAHPDNGLVPEGRSGCEPCESGSFSDTIGGTACAPCAPGSFSGPGQRQCTPCSPGTLSTAPGAAACALCPAGFSSLSNATACFACGAGAFAAGNGSAECAPCPPGQFQPREQQTACALCQPGSAAPFAGTAANCTPCGAGTFVGAEGASACRACAPGSFSEANASACTPCDAGSFAGSPRSVVCLPCPAGSAAPAPNSSACTPCSPGSAAPAGSVNCAACQVGFYSNGSLASCLPCGAAESTLGNGSASAEECLTTCPPGSFGVQGLSPSRDAPCELCPSGKFSGAAGAEQCGDCAAGKYAPQPGFDFCLPCAPGSISGSGQSECSLCPPGAEAPGSSSTGCSPCAAGFFASSNGTATCAPCPLGTYSTPARVVCDECPRGSSTPAEASTSSDDCDPLCPPGSFGLENGVQTPAAPCTNCSVGFYNPYSRQTACVECPAGTFSNLSGALECTACSDNFYSDEPGQTACLPCPDTELGQPTFTLGTGADSLYGCRVFGQQECIDSPRKYGVYPVFSSGKNDVGQAINESVVPMGNDRFTLDVQILTCNLFGSEEVVDMVLAGQHTIIKTARLLGTDPVTGASRFRFKLWGAGLNSHGQLGSVINAGTAAPNPVPHLLSPFLFPSRRRGNLVSAALGDNQFHYRMLVSGQVQLFNLTIPDGHYGQTDLVQTINELAVAEYGHAPGMLACTYSADDEEVSVTVRQPGVQFDFTPPNSVRELLGVPAVLVPNASEVWVNAEAGNNRFTYRAYCGTWPNCSGTQTVSITFASGVYTLSRINEVLEHVTNINGHGTEVFLIEQEGTHRVRLRISSPGFQVLFSAENSIASYLGFSPADVPSSGPWTSSEFLFHSSDMDRDLPYDLGDDTLYYEQSVRLATDAGMNAVRIVGGDEHTIVQTEDADTGMSRLWVFGSNKYGQLGVEVNAETDEANPVPLLLSMFDEMYGALEAVQIAAAGQQSFVLSSDGQLWVFGSNMYNQLGSPTNVGQASANWQPESITSVLLAFTPSDSSYEVMSFSLGVEHSVVQLVDAQFGDTLMITMGSNEFGQLGRAQNAGACIYHGMLRSCVDVWLIEKDRDALIPPPNGPAVLEEQAGSPFESSLRIISSTAGGQHTVFQTEDLRLWCVGSNVYGQCGFDTNSFYTIEGYGLPNSGPLPVGSRDTRAFGAVPSPPDAACCRLDGEAARCGACAEGEWEFDGSCTRCPFYRRPVVQYAAGKDHTLAMTNDTQLWSFGLNAFGQLLRDTPNLGLSNPNLDVSKVEVAQFGDESEVFLDFDAGGDQALVHLFRPYCREGNFSVDRRAPCSPCEPGSFSDTIGTLQREAQRSDDQSALHPHNMLFPVTFLDPPTLVSCPPCAAGSFAAESGASACSTCANGSYAFAGASSCHTCVNGTFAASAGSGNCSLCDPGSSSSRGSAACFPCPRGTEAPGPGTPQCVPCRPGYKNPVAGSDACQPCELDFYQELPGQASCVPCPDQRRTSTTGSASRELCLDLCTAGFFGAALVPGGLGLTPCTPCPVGFSSEVRGATECDPCPAGTYAPSNASTGCFPCPAGQSSLGLVGASSCDICTPGFFAPVNSSDCRPCQPGSFSGVEAGNCTLCDAGYYNDFAAATSCLPCDTGTTSEGGATLCRDCVPGEYGVGRLCLPCDAGLFSDQNRSTNCSRCGPGTVSTGGASQCTECSPGFYNSQYGASVCVACAPGKFSDIFGASTCRPCPAGSSSPQNATSCDLCDPGTFSCCPASPECSLCSPGSFSAANATVCALCDPGFFADEFGEVNCTACSAGYFANVSGRSVCSACPGGTFGNMSAMSACDNCAAGTVSATNATVCQDCIPGTFAARERMEACDLCDVGSFTAAFASVACSPCPPGSSTFGKDAGTDGRAAQVPEFTDAPSDCRSFCAPGDFAVWGVAPCVPCPAGFYSDSNLSTSCLPCRPGSSSVPGSTTCTECPAGTFAGLGSPSCVPCAPGFFQHVPASSSCEICAVSSYAEGPGNTECRACDLKIPSTSDILYLRDCRTSCSPVDDSGAPRSVNRTCCNSAPVLSVRIPRGELAGQHALTELEARINEEVFNLTGVNQLVRLEIDDIAWGYGLEANKTLTVRVQYGGFQLLFGPAPSYGSSFPESAQRGSPLQSAGACSSGSGCADLPGAVTVRDDQSRVDHLFYGAFSCECDRSCASAALCAMTECNELGGGCAAVPFFDLAPAASFAFFKQIGPALGFARAVPEDGPTECALPGETVSMDGGCYSAYSAVGDSTPDVLFTRLPGADDRLLCQNFCEAGTYDPDGVDSLSSPCQPCNSGNFSTIQGATSCQVCEPGTVTPVAGEYTACIPCAPGGFSADSGAAECQICPVGKFAPFSGSSVCEDCPAGTFSKVRDCGFQIGGVTVVSVDVQPHAMLDGLREGPAAASCDGVSNCTGAGFNATCQIQSGNVVTVTVFESGSGYDSRFPPTISCDAANETDGSIFALGSNASGVLLSPTITDSGAGLQCDAVSDVPDTCIECRPGHSSAAAAASCTICAAGTYTPFAASPSCALCEPGRFGAEPGALECQICAAGTYSEARLQSTACIDCPAGEFSLAESSTCQICPAGTYSTARSSTCTDCWPGSYSSAGASSCTPCDPGYISGRRQADFCDPCDPGEYAPTANLSSCSICPEGFFSNAAGSQYCDYCARGKYAGGGASSCIQCPPDRSTAFEAATRVTDCIDVCQPGFGGFFGVEPCFPCLPGTFTGAEATECTDFEVNTTTWDVSGVSYVTAGACNPDVSTCPGCPAGTFSGNESQTACDLCPLDTYSLGAVSECLPCPPGEVTLEPGASSTAFCKSFCKPGSRSDSTLSPCTACDPGTFNELLRQTACTDCPLGKYQDLYFGESCKRCPPGTGTRQEGQVRADACAGVVAKFLDEALCSNLSYVQDEGALNQLTIVEPGQGYADGMVVVSGASGRTFRGRFSTVDGQVRSVSVINEGSAYGSVGEVELVFESLTNPGQPSSKLMHGSVADVESKFSNLRDTPFSYLTEGCVRGTIDVDSETNGTGFEAYYGAMNGAFDLCIGTEDGDECVPNLDSHGVGFFSTPRIRLLETSIARINVWQNLTTRNCASETVLGATIQGRTDTEFAATAFAEAGRIQSVSVIDGSVYFFPGDSVYPLDSQCMCGDGIEQLQLASPGAGFLHEAAGRLFASNGTGAGFEGRYLPSEGGVGSVQVVAAGAGYREGVEVVACPSPSAWRDALQCCWYRENQHGPLPAGAADLVYDNTTGCFSNLTQPQFRFSVGLPGGVPGNFDRCLQVVVDEGGCRCGSGVEEIEIVAPGAGYVGGPLAVVQEESEYCGTAPADCPFDAFFCLEEWLRTRPDWCEMYGTGFVGSASTSAAAANASVMLDAGAVRNVTIHNPGFGYNKSYSRLALLYPEPTRCDDGSGAISDSCEQTGTVSDVLTTTIENSSMTAGELLRGMAVPGQGVAFATCDGIPGCTGFGFSGNCLLHGENLTVEITNHGTGYNAESPPLIWCVMSNSSSIDGNASTWLIGQNLSEGLWLKPTIADGLDLELLQGKPSGVFDNHDMCLEVRVPDGQAVLHFGALAQLQQRWLGSSFDGVTFSRPTLRLDEAVISNERLFWFMRAASGQDVVTQTDVTCDTSSEQRRLHGSTTSRVLRSIECVGTAEIWGATSLLSITFFEVLELPARVVQVHLSMLSIRPSSTQEWLPFRYSGLALFDGIPSDSWSSSIGFGGAGKPAFEAFVQASTIAFNHTACRLCGMVSRSAMQWSHAAEDGTAVGWIAPGVFMFREGLALKAGGVHLREQAPNTFRFLQLERFLPLVRAGATSLLVDAFLPVSGCLWPSIDAITWRILVNEQLSITPSTFSQASDAVEVRFTGMGRAPTTHVWVAFTAQLLRNEPVEIWARLMPEPDAGEESGVLKGRGESGPWESPMGVSWLSAEANTIEFQLQYERSVTHLTLETFNFTATGIASFPFDPFTDPRGLEQTPVTIRGTTGSRFPQVFAQVEGTLVSSDPAAIVRTLTSEAVELPRSSQTCGTSASADLLFEDRRLAVQLSTWNFAPYEVPYADPRQYTCSTVGGSVEQGTACQFPFEYNGQTFWECTKQDWTVPWCATSSIFDGDWGQCQCDGVRRGVTTSSRVRLDEHGPMLDENLDKVLNLIAPIDDGAGLSGVNVTMQMYYPLYDSNSTRHIEMGIRFVPRDASSCSQATPVEPTSENSPVGECERLGLITEWLGEPGDTSMMFCRTSDEVSLASEEELKDILLTAATEANLPRNRTTGGTASSAPIRVSDRCIRDGLFRELSVCSTDVFRALPIAAPGVVGHQFCFWTDTSSTQATDAEKYFGGCSICGDTSCSAAYEPYRAWQLDQRP